MKDIEALVRIQKLYVTCRRISSINWDKVNLLRKRDVGIHFRRKLGRQKGDMRYLGR